jgi:peptidyl-prolyl cis-trans isomerase A (cyclophilin A)
MKTVLSVLLPFFLSLLLVSLARCEPSVGAERLGGDPRAPDHFTVQFIPSFSPSTPIVLNVTRAWAPIGVDHFYALLNDHFYDMAAFFRVVPNFVVQFGIAGVPAENNKWSTAIKDDPVVASNVQWTVSYATAGPNTRTTQIFINLVDNSFLDADGFAPFATVIKGMDVVNKIYNPTPGDQNGVDQDKYMAYGNSWITKNYPLIDFSVKTVIQ